ncbi:MAG: hypothetical protein KA463_06210 [Flavobacterium sp.]|nr:hypothetical protein [Flavobacterium sp.]
MENFSASHINDLIGNSGKKYTADKFVRYPFNGDFSIKNCICILFSIVNNINYKREIVVFNITYFNDFTKDTFLSDFDFKGFSCNGALILHTSEEDAFSIIDDLKSNKSNFKEKYVDCTIINEV